MRTFRFWTSHNNRDGASWARKVCAPDDVSFAFDETDPEYLFVGEHLYVHADRMRKFLELDDGRRVSVWHNGEAVFPDMNLFDYAFVFDREAALGDRLCRIPTVSRFDSAESFGAREAVDPGAELRRKTGFCNFIYSNPKAHPRRDQLFHLLNAYRPVDALGPHLNNRANATTRLDADWKAKSVVEKRPYKFSIASEIARYDGYVSEKIATSFRAHTVPVYWGDPGVVADYNPEAFINANGLSDAELVEAVRRVDEDDALWMKMVAAPVQTPAQTAQDAADLARVKAFSARLFDGRPLTEKKRAPVGFWNGGYRMAVARQCEGRKPKGLFGRIFG